MQTRLPDQIIVVDDCSADATGAVARLCGADVVARSHRNTGKGRALNLGLALAETDIVITVDADTILASDAVERIIVPFADPRVSAACGFVVPQRLTSVWERGRLMEYLWFLSLFKRVQDHLNTVIVLSGCFTAFRRSALAALGGFKHRTITEDLDLTWELLIAGHQIRFVPDAVCYPLEPNTWRVYHAQVRRWARGFFQTVEAHREDLARNRRLQLLVAAALVDLVVSPLFLLGIVLAGAVWGPIGLAWVLGLDFVLVVGPSSIGAVQKGLVREAVISFPFLYVNRICGLGIYWSALIREWIFRQHLHAWEKGH